MIKNSSFFMICVTFMFFFAACNENNTAPNNPNTIVPVALESVAPGPISRTYYVDASSGNDAWSGLISDPQANSDGPWQTLDKVTSHTLQPGDKVLLKRGSVWRNHREGATPATNRLYIEESGTPTQPIIIDAYGTGPAPTISGGRLFPQHSNWTAADESGVYKMDIGSTSEFFTSIPVMVRGTPTGATGYVLLRRIDTGTLTADSYKTSSNNGRRFIEYRPMDGQLPSSYDFEVSINGSPILITGSDVHVSNINGMLANREHPKDLLEPRGSGVFRGEGARVRFSNCTASFSGAYGVVVRGPDSVIDGCSATHNHSTGLYIENRDQKGTLGLPLPDRGIIQNSRSEFNGNLEADDLDKGGIGVQSNYAIIRHNVVRSNGNLNNLVDTEDAAISLFDCHDVTVDQNYIVNSVRNAIGASYGPASHGHKIIRNVIHNWNLEGVVSYQNNSAIYLAPFGNTENSGRFTVHNNTIYSDLVAPQLFGIQINMPTSTDFLANTSVKNNIVYLKENIHAATRGLRINRNQLTSTVIDYNNIFVHSSTRFYQYAGEEYPNNSTTFPAAQGYENHSINTDPQFVVATPVTDVDFNLSATSPNKDKGTPVELTEDYSGSPIPRDLAPDIGAFEY